MNPSRQKWPPRRDRGPHGRLLCRVCGAEVAGRRRTFCSDACVARYLEDADWNGQRQKVFKRDRGVCQRCGFDTDKLRRILDAVGQRHDVWFHRDRRTAHEVLVAVGCTYGEAHKELWQADHIVPRCRGGSNTLDNLRTLCIFCHKGETKRLVAERAHERRTVAPLPLLETAHG